MRSSSLRATDLRVLENAGRFVRPFGANPHDPPLRVRCIVQEARIRHEPLVPFNDPGIGRKPDGPGVSGALHGRHGAAAAHDPFDRTERERTERTGERPQPSREGRRARCRRWDRRPTRCRSRGRRADPSGRTQPRISIWVGTGFGFLPPALATPFSRRPLLAHGHGPSAGHRTDLRRRVPGPVPMWPPSHPPHGGRSDRDVGQLSARTVGTVRDLRRGYLSPIRSRRSLSLGRRSRGSRAGLSRRRS